MFVEVVQNNGNRYLRLVHSERVVNKDGYKVSRKKVVMNIGPLAKYDDGQPNYVQRLKQSFQAGSPLIPALLPFCAKERPAEQYHIIINEGSPYCFGHPKLYCHSVMVYGAFGCCSQGRMEHGQGGAYC